jgi:ABC-2 type transport system ATP-binding protein
MISINNLQFTYRKSGKQLFSGLSLSMHPGSICGLLGKNGAGKTTLLKLITGLRFSQSGEIKSLGFIPAKRDPRMLQQMFLVPEDLHIPPVTADAFVNLQSSLYPRFDRKSFSEFLKQFEVPEKSNLATLSFGQKKKFLLAFGCAANCPLLILDEPTNGLDIPSKTQFRNLLASVLKPDRSIIISTHQVRDVEGLIDSVIILDEGTMILQEKLSAILSRVIFEQAKDLPSDKLILYSEIVPGGFTFMHQNKTSAESRIDLELLFNAAISKRDTVVKALAGGAA